MNNFKNKLFGINRSTVVTTIIGVVLLLICISLYARGKSTPSAGAAPHVSPSVGVSQVLPTQSAPAVQTALSLPDAGITAELWLEHYQGFTYEQSITAWQEALVPYVTSNFVMNELGDIAFGGPYTVSQMTSHHEVMTVSNLSVSEQQTDLYVVCTVTGVQKITASGIAPTSHNLSYEVSVVPQNNQWKIDSILPSTSP